MIAVRRALALAGALVVFQAGCGSEMTGDNLVSQTDDSGSIGGDVGGADLPETMWAAAVAGSVIYTDALATGWTDWSWATHNLANASPVASGSGAISRVPAARAASTPALKT